MSFLKIHNDNNISKLFNKLGQIIDWSYDDESND